MAAPFVLRFSKDERRVFRQPVRGEGVTFPSGRYIEIGTPPGPFHDSPVRLSFSAGLLDGKVKAGTSQRSVFGLQERPAR
jgi:hypothetical protein